MPMSLWKRKGGKKKGGVESQKYDLLCSMHKPLKSGVFFAQAVKTGVFALLLFTAKHLDQRGRAWKHSLLQVQSEPFDTTLGGLALGDVKIFLKSGCNFGVGTLQSQHIISVWEMSRDCCKSCSQMLQPKARSPCARQCPDVPHKNRRTGSTCYPHPCNKGLVELMLSLPWKQRCKGLQRGGMILKLAPSQDQTSTWELNYFLAV